MHPDLEQELNKRIEDIPDKCAGMVAAETFDFGQAIRHLKNGQHVHRLGWNGRGMYLGLQYPTRESANNLPYIWIQSRQGRVPWLASQTDMLSNDWILR